MKFVKSIFNEEETTNDDAHTMMIGNIKILLKNPWHNVISSRGILKSECVCVYQQATAGQAHWHCTVDWGNVLLLFYVDDTRWLMPIISLYVCAYIIHMRGNEWK